MSRGNTIIIVLIIVAVISSLSSVLSKILSYLQNSSTTLIDHSLAVHYSQLALTQAEQDIYHLECPDNNCANGFANIKIAQCQQYGSIAQNRTCALNTMYGITLNAGICNRGNQWHGFCGNFQNNILFSKNNPSYWQIKADATPPCEFYSNNISTSGKFEIPLIDDRNNNYTRRFETYNQLLCAQPRYMIEFIDLDYQTLMPGSDNTITHGTLYRITARAFGRNGNIKNTIQEYLVIDTNITGSSQKFVRLSKMTVNELTE